MGVRNCILLRRLTTALEQAMLIGGAGRYMFFRIYLLFAVDYVYYLPGDMLVYGDKVTLRPSFEILAKWSHGSWDDDGDIDDPKRTRDLAVFFGRASTIFFVAINDTGLVKPSPTFATMEGFYNKALGSSKSSNYADAIKKAITS